MASGDEDLVKYLETQRLSYTSPQIQNEIIEICGEVILEKIVSKINQAECFSILADDTTDVSGIEQFSLCARYTDEINETIVMREDFLKFVPVEDVTGLGLSQTLITVCNNLKLNLTFLRGQGYDGASVMSGEFQGCATRVMEQYPQALYVHCASHSLNLAVGDACSLPIIRNSLGTIKEIITFFRCSAKRQTILQRIVSELNCEIKKRRLTKYCQTRWVERLDSVITFKEFFPSIFIALENIQETGNTESSKSAFMFQKTLKDGKFIVAMIVINEMFALAQPLSVSLQSVQVDLASALEMANNLSSLLKSMRENAELKFRELFATAQDLANELGEEIKIPRVTTCQIYRENYPSRSPEEYFRRTIFIPFIDHFLSQLEQRFLKHKETLSKIQNIIPNVIIKLSEIEINETINVISMQWPNALETCDIICKKEALLWKQRWVGVDEIPRTFIEALQLCNKVMFPNIHNFLKIGTTLPVTVSSVERSFSTLKRTKTYLRNSTQENRLNGLALLSIHREIPVEVEEVINRFAQKNRKLAL